MAVRTTHTILAGLVIASLVVLSTQNNAHRLVFYSLSRTQSKQPELLTYSTLNCYTASREDLADLRSAAVVPDVLSRLDQAAGVTLNISYGADVNFHTSAGHLTLAQTANAPTAVGGPDNAFYSLALSDPDAPIPSNPSAREWLHWLVVNAPADNLGSGEALFDYNAPAPPGGVHRYIFTLYSQPGGAPVNVTKPESRANFRAGQFGAQAGLVPVNAAYFTAETGV